MRPTVSGGRLSKVPAAARDEPGESILAKRVIKRSQGNTRKAAPRVAPLRRFIFQSKQTKCKTSMDIPLKKNFPKWLECLSARSGDFANLNRTAAYPQNRLVEMRGSPKMAKYRARCCTTRE